MWIALTVPFMVVGCVIAIISVLIGSIYHHRSEGGPGSPQHENRAQAADSSGQARRSAVELVCSPCGTVLRAASSDELSDAVSDHAWRMHGVPHPERVLATAAATPDISV